MYDKDDYGHHIQFSADWKLEEKNAEGSHVVDIYDGDIWSVTDQFIKFLSAEYEWPRERVIERILEHIMAER